MTRQGWQKVWLFMIVATPGIFATVPSLIGETTKVQGISVPTIVGIVSVYFYVFWASVLGIVVQRRIDIKTPLLDAIIAEKDVWKTIKDQLIPAIKYGGLGTVLFLCAYYAVQSLEPLSFKLLHSMRMKLGLLSRVLYGGVVEEILCRFGVMSGFLWIFQSIFKRLNTMTIWLAIILSGIIFGLGHIPAFIGTGGSLSPAMLSMIIGLNLYAALIFGGLFWHFGLTSAILGHMTFHLLWFPFDWLSQ